MKTVEDPLLQELVSFLNQLGTETIKHSGDKNYLAHLVAVHRAISRSSQLVPRNVILPMR